LRADGKLLKEPAGLSTSLFSTGARVTGYPDEGYASGCSVDLDTSQLVCRTNVAVTAGACDARLAAAPSPKEAKRQVSDLWMAYVDGDEVVDAVNRLIKNDTRFTSLMDGEALADWGYMPIYAQCYLGGACITRR
jgi:hypothetical protein